MTTIVHRTPGLLDPRSFTISGMSAKPSTTSPIGQFGTGLKYAIAGLLRSGARLSIWIGREHWQFELEETEFRGQPFRQIVAWRRAWGGLRRQRVRLPFTTQLGPHWTWWMWMRELHANTLDEGGETLVVTPAFEDIEAMWRCCDEGREGVLGPAEDTTCVVVDHPEYAAAWEARAEVFLPGARGPAGAASGQVLEAIPGPAQRLYYRGLRVLDLRLPTVACTWNILEQTPLTEDRTMHEWYAQSAIARWLVRTCEDEDLIQRILEADEHCWEHGLELPHHIRPSEAFARASHRVRRPGPRLTGYSAAWAPPAPPDERPFWERRGRAWQLHDEELLDERGSVVLSRPEHLDQDDWRELAGTVLVAVRAPEGTCPTCRQVVPSGPPPRPMVSGDLYAGLDHDWQEYDGMHRCTRCGVILHEWWSDTRLDPCEGPEWMRPEPELCHTCSRPVSEHPEWEYDDECTMEMTTAEAEEHSAVEELLDPTGEGRASHEAARPLCSLCGQPEPCGCDIPF